MLNKVAKPGDATTAVTAEQTFLDVQIWIDKDSAPQSSEKLLNICFNH